MLLLKLLKVLLVKVSCVSLPTNVSVILGKVILTETPSCGYKLVWCELSLSYKFIYPAV